MLKSTEQNVTALRCVSDCMARLWLAPVHSKCSALHVPATFCVQCTCAMWPASSSNDDTWREAASVVQDVPMSFIAIPALLWYATSP